MIQRIILTALLVFSGLSLSAGPARADDPAFLSFGVGAFDPLTFVTMPSVLIGAAALAAWVAARRAGAIDPATALRAE